MSDGDRTSLGEELNDLDELLLRQVAPLALVEEGVPSSLAFMPRGSDAGCLSVDRGSCTTPEAAYRLARATRPQGFALNTVGVWGISLREVREASLRAFSDPIAATEGSPPNCAHALVDFRLHNGGQQKKRAQQLKVRALARGRLYPVA